MIVSLSPAAAKDIEQIGDYIHADSPRAAVTFVRAMRARCESLVNAPEGGTPRFDIRAGLRSVVFRSYLIFYTVSASGIRIERIMHGRRNIEATFDDHDDA